MQQKLPLLLTGMFLSSLAFAQSASPELTAFNETRLHINQTGMLVLGSWAIGNIGISAFGLNQATGPDKYFNQMNIYWNVVNLALAGVGYHGAVTGDPTAFTAFASLKEHYGTEKVLLLNAGLDVAYVMGGLYLTERANNAATGKPQDRLRGFGRSIVLQGSFLLLFDVSMFLIHHHHLNQTKGILDNLRLSGNSAGVVLRF